MKMLMELKKILKKQGFNFYKKKNEKVYIFKKDTNLLTINLAMNIIEMENIHYLNFITLRAITNFLIENNLK